MEGGRGTGKGGCRMEDCGIRMGYALSMFALAKGQSQHVEFNASNEALALLLLISLLPRPACVCHAYTRVRLISAALNSERKNFINNARKIVRNCQNNLC